MMTELAPLPVFEKKALLKEEPILNVIKKASSETTVLCPDLVTSTRLTIIKRYSIKQALALKGLSKNFEVISEDSTIYTVREESQRIAGYFCYGLRPFILKVFDRNCLEILRIRRRFSCTSRVMPCFMQSVEVSSQYSVLGTVEQVWKPIAPEYLVKNNEGQPLYRVIGPTFVFFKDIQFKIQKMDGQVIGTTYKRWRSLKSYFFRAENLEEFGVAYNQDLSVDHKVLLFAATLLIDYMYH